MNHIESNAVGEIVRSHDELESALSASDKRVKELEAVTWQPISTAPRCEEILGYWLNGDIHVVEIYSNGECHRPMDEEAWAMPTHWMPLPAAPEDK